jgi:hypothetical protein
MKFTIRGFYDSNSDNNKDREALLVEKRSSLINRLYLIRDALQASSVEDFKVDNINITPYRNEILSFLFECIKELFELSAEIPNRNNNFTMYKSEINLGNYIRSEIISTNCLKVGELSVHSCDQRYIEALKSHVRYLRFFQPGSWIDISTFVSSYGEDLVILETSSKSYESYLSLQTRKRNELIMFVEQLINLISR